MVGKRSLKIVTVVLFAIFCLQPVFDSEYREYVIGNYYMEIIKAFIYLLLIIFLIVDKGKIYEKIVNKKWVKWLYVLPIIFFLAAMIRRVEFLSVYFEKFTLDLRGADWFAAGYTVDYNHLLREAAILLLMFSIINPLVFRKEGEKKEKDIGRCALVAGTLFAILSVWLLYRSAVYAIYYGVYRDHFLGTKDYFWRQIVFLLCVYGITAFSLFKRNRKLLTVGISILFLYVVCCSRSRHYIPSSSWHDVCYLFGYACILVVSIVMIVLEKKGKELKSKLWLILPALFLVLNFVWYIRDSFVAEYCSVEFIWDYQSVVQDFAIFFAILWAIYPKGLPKWEKLRNMGENGNGKENKNGFM